MWDEKLINDIQLAPTNKYIIHKYTILTPFLV